MERKRNLPIEQLPNQEHEASACEIEESSVFDFYSDKDLARIKNELATLRRESLGGTMEAHQEWLERFIKRKDCLAFLHIHKGEIVSALLGTKLPLDELPYTISEYIEQYAEDSNQRPILWCDSITTHPDHQGQGLAGDCLSRFVEYAESYYRITGVFLACRIREQNFASEITFTRAGFQRTHLLDEEDAHGNNYINFRFWVKTFPIHSPSAEIFIPPEKLYELRASNAPYFTHPQ